VRREAIQHEGRAIRAGARGAVRSERDTGRRSEGADAREHGGREVRRDAPRHRLIRMIEGVAGAEQSQDLDLSGGPDLVTEQLNGLVSLLRPQSMATLPW